MEKTWKTLSGSEVTDYIEQVKKYISEGATEIHVGTDSQQYSDVTEFATVIALINPGHGGRVLWTKYKQKRIHSLRERLLKEVLMSVEHAIEVNMHISEDVKLSVHVDVNPNVEFKSSKYIQEMVGMVVGQGLTVLTKPYGWAAAHVADHIVKHKNEHRETK